MKSVSFSLCCSRASIFFLRRRSLPHPCQMHSSGIFWCSVPHLLAFHQKDQQQLLEKENLVISDYVSTKHSTENLNDLEHLQSFSFNINRMLMKHSFKDSHIVEAQAHVRPPIFGPFFILYHSKKHPLKVTQESVQSMRQGRGFPE